MDTHQQQAIIAFGYKDSVGIEQLNQMSFSKRMYITLTRH